MRSLPASSWRNLVVAVAALVCLSLVGLAQRTTVESEATTDRLNMVEPEDRSL